MTGGIAVCHGAGAVADELVRGVAHGEVIGARDRDEPVVCEAVGCSSLPVGRDRLPGEAEGADRQEGAKGSRDQVTCTDDEGRIGLGIGWRIDEGGDKDFDIDGLYPVVVPQDEVYPGGGAWKEGEVVDCCVVGVGGEVRGVDTLLEAR